MTINNGDGSSWSQATNHPYANSGCSLTGTQSAGLTCGGHGNPAGPNVPVHPSYSATNISTEWDGSSWGSTATPNYAFSSGKSTTRTWDSNKYKKL